MVSSCHFALCELRKQQMADERDRTSYPLRSHALLGSKQERQDPTAWSH